MAERLDCDIAVIGAGAGGIAVATGAAVMGARTILIERGRMGGNRLHGGDIPAAALIAAGRHAVAWRAAETFGIRHDEPEIDFAAVMRRVQATVAAQAPSDSAERLSALGATVLQGEARFTAADRLAVGDTVIRPRHVVIASGSRPTVPPIEGLGDIPYLTTDTLFASLTERPLHLLVIGGGPSGVELAQAFRRLGTRVTLIERLRCLNRCDPELGGLLVDTLRAEGVIVHEQTEVTLAENTVSGIVLTLHHADGSSTRIAGSHLLLTAGRTPNIADLDLAAANVDSDARGITVDTRLRATNRRIWAVGDVTGLHPATHTARHHATVVLKNILFHLPVRIDPATLPYVVYGDPEYAGVGLSESEARARHGRISILRQTFAANDRARAEGRLDGLLKVIVTPNRGRILGVTIAGPMATDLLQPWQLALSKGLGAGAMQALPAAHPTRGEAGKAAAGDFYRPRLLSPILRRFVQLLARFD